jgi:hypothetical protein
MIVSTTPWAIQPSSLNTTGTASTTMARNSAAQGAGEAARSGLLGNDEATLPLYPAAQSSAKSAPGSLPGVVHLPV